MCTSSKPKEKQRESASHSCIYIWQRGSIIKKSSACSPAFLITLPFHITALESAIHSKLCPKSIHQQHRFWVAKYIPLISVLMKSAPLKHRDRPVSTAQPGKRGGALQASRVWHWEHSAVPHDSPRNLALRSDAKCGRPSPQHIPDDQHGHFPMDFGQWLVVAPPCDVFRLDKIQVQMSNCSNLLLNQPWDLLCPGEYLQPCLTGFGHKPSCIGTQITFSPTLRVSLKWIWFGKDITLFKTSYGAVRSAWALMNCTVSGDQSHCLGLDCVVASGLSAWVQNLLLFKRWRRTKSWCPCGCEGPGPGTLPPSFQSSMDTPGQPVFPGASRRHACSASPSQNSLEYFCPSV